jgi:uncharacterized protein (TIGR02118 family)
MGVKLLVLYPPPKDSATFDRLYAEEHLPMAGKLLTRATGLDVLRGLAAPDGGAPAYHLAVIVSYPDQAALEADLGSEGGQKTAAHAVEISTGGPPVLLVCNQD